MRTHAAECAVDFPGMAMQELVDRYGALLVFANVLALSLGLPVPAMPTLVLVGAGLQPEAMWLPLLGVLAVSVAASLIGDSVWFYAGRRYGNRTLQSLCRLSLSRDTTTPPHSIGPGKVGSRYRTENCAMRARSGGNQISTDRHIWAKVSQPCTITSGKPLSIMKGRSQCCGT